MIKKYLIGTSGWNYPHWTGKFYPKNISKKDWFDFYSKNFNTVEVNYSFYRWPSKKTMEKWYKEAPRNFKFTLKAPRTITHIKKLKNTERQIADFYKLSSLLKEKLGALLFQLPPSMKFNDNNFKKFEKFLKSLNKNKDNVIEFRHKSWWNKEVYHLLKKNKITFCIVSGLGMPEEIISTNDIAYFRFHGRNYSTLYPKNAIKKYANIMKNLRCKKIYAYFNNDANAYSIKNARELKGEVGGILSKNL